MAKGLICDRCGAVITKYCDMNELRIIPYNGNMLLSDGKAKKADLCQECTETVMQYINGDVQMVIFNDSKADKEQDYE